MYKFITVLCFVLFVSTSCADSPEKQEKEFSQAAKARCIKTINKTISHYIKNNVNKTQDVPKTKPKNYHDDGDKALLEMELMMIKGLINDINKMKSFGTVKETSVYGNLTLSCNDKIHDSLQSIIKVLDQIKDDSAKRKLEANRSRESTTRNQKKILHGEKLISEIVMVP